MSNEARLGGLELPAGVAQGLETFLDSAREALGADLRSAVLYGSAAEGRMRATSDVNLVLVLSRFDAEKADRLRDPVRTAYAAIRLEAMLLLESEVAAAVEAFAVKFAEILRRRHVLVGDDPFAGRKPSRSAEIARLKQVLLNLVLRLRERYMLQSLRDEQATRLVADAVGPLRACAATLIELRGMPAAHDPLAEITRGLPGQWDEALTRMTEARERRKLPPAAGAATVLRMIELATAMRGLAEEVFP